MRKILHIVILLTLIFSGREMFAQQDPHYSMYMLNNFVLNPAYAGSRDQLSMTAMTRQQWTGIRGAPATQVLTLHGPSRNLRHGWGFSFSNDQLSVISDQEISGAYAFRIPIGESSNLSLGLQMTLSHYKAALGNVRTDEPDDVAFLEAGVNIWRPNAGGGIWFSNDRMFAGLSAPKLINHGLTDPLVAGTFASRRRHAFFTAGGVVPVGNALKIKPSFLLKYAERSPWQADINCSFLFWETIWVGASYRTEDAVVGMLEIQLTKQWRIGYAYDYTLSTLGPYTSGSHELMLGFDFNFNRKRMISPRYF